MKRISVSSLAQVLLVSGGVAASGCGGSTPPPATAQTETAQETPADATAVTEAASEIRTADASLPPAPPVVADTPSFGPGRQPILQTAGERKVRDDDAEPLGGESLLRREERAIDRPAVQKHQSRSGADVGQGAAAGHLSHARRSRRP